VELVPARPQRWLVWLIIASLIVPLAFVGLIAHQARRAALEAADQHISGTVMLLREHAQKVLDTDDLVIQQVDRLTAGMSWDDIAHSEALHRQLKQLDDGLPQMRGIYVIAPNGTIVGSSRSFPAAPSNATNRDFFSAIRNGYPGTFISRPYTEPTTGNQQFSVARRRSSPDGAFDGVIVAADSATYFEAAYQYIGEEAAAVVLARSDGEELASYPTPMFAGSRIPADLVTQTSEKSPLIVRSIPAPYDGTDRLGGYQRLHGYPLLVGYSISASSVTAAWLRMVILNGVLVLLGSLAVAVIADSGARRLPMPPTAPKPSSASELNQSRRTPSGWRRSGNSRPASLTTSTTCSLLFPAISNHYLTTQRRSRRGDSMWLCRRQCAGRISFVSC
jgi:hypothetical protein